MAALRAARLLAHHRRVVGAATRPLARAFASKEPPPHQEDRTFAVSSQQLFASLGLRTFSKEELKRKFDEMDRDGDGASDAARFSKTRGVGTNEAVAAPAWIVRGPTTGLPRFARREAVAAPPPGGTDRER